MFLRLMKNQALLTSRMRHFLNSSITENSPKIRDHNLKVEKVFGGLNFSTSMAFLGSNDIVVLDKERGRVHRILNGTIFLTYRSTT
jgi:glucose/arabinose dehydrogenase